MRNPFTPTFGTIPPVMAGRERLVATLVQALENGPGDPNLATLLVGARGTGKTALLSRIEREAEAAGWVTASVSALPGMLDDILIRGRRAAAHLIETSESPRIKGVNLAPFGGIELDYPDNPLQNWRSRMEDLLDELEAHQVGLLVTIDEVNPKLDEMVRFTSDFQHFVREERRVGVVMAGLPGKISALVSHSDISFLRRARHHHFGRISDAEIQVAFNDTVQEAGRHIGYEAMREAIRAINGFPYMMQLVGYEAWNQSPDTEELSLDDVLKGIDLARDEMSSHILEATFRELSRKDRHSQLPCWRTRAKAPFPTLQHSWA